MSIDLNLTRQVKCSGKLREELNRADIQVLRSAMRSLKLRKKIEYAYCGNDTEDAYTIRLATMDVAYNLAQLTDDQYPYDVWRCLDKTDFPSQAYELLKDILAQAINEHGDRQGGNPHRQPSLTSITKAHYNVYEPVEEFLWREELSTWKAEGYRASSKPRKSHIKVWCPVMQEYASNSPKPTRKLSHIIPPRLGEKNLCALLGYDMERKPMSDPDNLMYLDTSVAAAFDKGHITFVPMAESRPGSGPLNYKVVVVNRDTLNDAIEEGSSVKWTDLDDRQLLFKNRNRPAKRYMYLHNILCFMRANVSKFEGWESLEDRLFSKSSYATPEAFVRSDMLKWLADSVACNLPENWRDHVFMRYANGPSQACLQRRGTSFARRWKASIGLV